MGEVSQIICARKQCSGMSPVRLFVCPVCPLSLLHVFPQLFLPSTKAVGSDTSNSDTSNSDTTNSDTSKQ